MATQKKDWSKVKVKGRDCPTARLAFPKLMTAEKVEADNGETYNRWSCSLLFPKTTDLKALRQAAHNAAVEKWGPKEKWPKGLKMPFRNGDDVEWNGYAGTVFVNVSSTKRKPVCIDGQRNHIEDADELYPGCYVKADLTAGTYETKGNKGVKFYLQAVQKVKEGERLDRQFNAEESFDEESDSSEDQSSYEEQDEIHFE